MRMLRWVGCLVVALIALMTFHPEGRTRLGTATTQGIEQILIFGAVAGSMVRVKLGQPVWDENKKLYRPGDNVEMPSSLAEKLGLAPNSGEQPEGGGKSSEGPSSGNGEPQVDEDGFSEDFPGRSALKNAGLTRADVDDMEEADLLAIEGIGDATAAKILAARG